MPTFIMGKDAKIYQGAALAELAVLTEMSNVKDVNLTLEAGSADVSTRANSGWRAKAVTLRELTAEFEMVWLPDDPSFAAILAAFLAGTTLELAILDQARTVSGAQGPKGSFVITSCSRSEPLEEAIKASVKVELSVFDEWITVA